MDFLRTWKGYQIQYNLEILYQTHQTKAKVLAGKSHINKDDQAVEAFKKL
ncbi:MAG: hypothetical protein M9887_03690 [Chitinophagales bacterium]|nr:hypothetical protein [Chitinophagales bacterium]